MQGVLKSYGHIQEGNDLKPWNLHVISHIHPEVGTLFLSFFNLSKTKKTNKI